MSEPADDFRALDDPAFLAERAHLRTELEHAPANAVERPELERLYQAMTDEFDHRARRAWATAG
jgi:hypothetical protein